MSRHRPVFFGNSFGSRQPFPANDTDKIGVSISQNNLSPPVAKFTLLSWDNATYTVALESCGNWLAGVGSGGEVYAILLSDWLLIIRLASHYQITAKIVGASGESELFLNN